MTPRLLSIRYTDILENIPSDGERLAATDGGGRRYRFRRPAAMDIFCTRARRARSEERAMHDADASVDSSLRYELVFLGR